MPRIKKSFRLKTKKIIPLSKQEECSYYDGTPMKDKMEKVKEGKYFGLNGDIHIRNAIPKTNLEALYVGLHDLILENPIKQFLASFFLKKI